MLHLPCLFTWISYRSTWAAQVVGPYVVLTGTCLLLWATRLPWPAKLAVWLLIELCWNVYPSTAESSLCLLACHVVLVAALLLAAIERNAALGRHVSGAPPRARARGASGRRKVA